MMNDLEGSEGSGDVTRSGDLTQIGGLIPTNSPGYGAVGPDDSLGSLDVSGSGLPRGGTREQSQLPQDSPNKISEQISGKQFADALSQLERSRDLAPFLNQFSPDATAMRNGELTRPKNATMEEFWRTYLSEFETVSSTFAKIVESDKIAVLEWESRGKLAINSLSIGYRGVSILEKNQGKIVSFSTYYTTSSLAHPKSLESE